QPISVNRVRRTRIRRKYVLKESYWLNLIDVRPGGRSLGQHRGRLKILRAACGIRQIYGHGQIRLHRQTSADTAHVRNLERRSRSELPLQRKVEDVGVRGLHVLVQPPVDSERSVPRSVWKPTCRRGSEQATRIVQ